MYVSVTPYNEIGLYILHSLLHNSVNTYLYG